MREILFPALLLAVILTACAHTQPPIPTATPEPTPTATATPTPTPTPTSEPRALQSAWLEVDKNHRFWVELQKTDEPSPITEAFIHNGSTYDGLRVNIYADQDEPEPIQSFLSGYNCHPRSLEFSIGDWNFDGYNDLAFTNAVIGSRCYACDFYIWDPDTRQLVHDPYGLGDLNYPELYPESQVITSLFPINGGSETYRHYRYEDGKLTLTRECQRILNFESETYTYSVEGLMNGSWKTLFQGEGDPDDITDRAASEYQDWRDEFDYPPTLWGFPIDDTHDAFEVDTKGRLGTVLVTVEIENEDPGEYQFSVWIQDDLNKPLQTMSAESFGLFHWSSVIDANFDGHMDFGYMYAMGNQPCYWHYWIWNEAKGRFVQEPEFDQISEPQFDEETGIISGYARSSAASGTATFHCWENGKLVCIREVEVCYPNWGESQVLVVRDRIDGELVEVFCKTFGPPEDNSPIYDEASKWYDLSYHG